MTENHQDELRLAEQTLNALYPLGWTVEDLENVTGSVPVKVRNATLAGWVSSGRVCVVGEEHARHPAAKGRPIKVYSRPYDR